jgi:hypothetical protein
MLFVEMYIAPRFFTWVLSDVKRISIAKNKNTNITCDSPKSVCSAFQRLHQAARRSYRRCNPPTSAISITAPKFGACLALGSGASFESATRSSQEQDAGFSSVIY